MTLFTRFAGRVRPYRNTPGTRKERAGGRKRQRHARHDSNVSLNFARGRPTLLVIRDFAPLELVDPDGEDTGSCIASQEDIGSPEGEMQRPAPKLHTISTASSTGRNSTARNTPRRAGSRRQAFTIGTFTLSRCKARRNRRMPRWKPYFESTKVLKNGVFYAANRSTE